MRVKCDWNAHNYCQQIHNTYYPTSPQLRPIPIPMLPHPSPIHLHTAHPIPTPTLYVYFSTILYS